MQNSSVAPGYTVLSNITIWFGLSFMSLHFILLSLSISPIVIQAFDRAVRSGLLLVSTGVGTVTIKTSVFKRSFTSLVKLKFLK